MKKHLLALACASVVATPTIALAELSANIGVTSNYIWRGVSQSGDDAAISGGVDFAHESGFYAGSWISSLGGNSGADGPSAEVDFYAGFGGEYNAIGYDVGAIIYHYPSGDDLDFTELYGSLSYSFFEAGLAYTVDSDAGGDDSHVYYYASASFDIAEDWSISATIGHYNFDGGSDTDYTHGQIDLTKSAGDFGDFTFTVSKASSEVNTLLSPEVGPAVTDADDPIFLVSWTKSF